MIIIDTNVISEFMRAVPEPRVVDWLDSCDTAELWLTAITAAELHAGINKLAPGEKRARLAGAVADTLDEFDGRILPFDADAALVYGELVGPLLAKKLQFPIMDYQLAAIALVRGASLATRNAKDFTATGVAVINPWES
jgi:predicted nucleic acid-binding protein